MRTQAESPNIRISPKAKTMLRTLAVQESKSMQAVLEEAVERYQREKLLDQANEAFAALRKDPKAWEEELAERALWDTALMDGLEDE